MKAFQFAKVDWKITKSYSGRMTLILIAAAFLLYFVTDNFVMGIMYLYFGALITSTIPFSIREDSESGFLLMLPSKVMDRVAGRFLYGNLIIVAAAVLGMGIAVITSLVNHDTISFSFTMIYLMVGFSFCLIVSGFQSLILYLAGEIKSRQTLQWLRMLPGFIFFFGGSALINILQDITGLSANEIFSQPSVLVEKINGFTLFIKIISFIIDQPYISVLIVLVVSVLINSICCIVSGFVAEKR